MRKLFTKIVKNTYRTEVLPPAGKPSGQQAEPKAGLQAYPPASKTYALRLVFRLGGAPSFFAQNIILCRFYWDQGLLLG